MTDGNWTFIVSSDKNQKAPGTKNFVHTMYGQTGQLEREREIVCIAMMHRLSSHLPL